MLCIKAYEATGFQCEIMAVQAALREVKKCCYFTHAESRIIARLIEDVRKS